MSLLFASFLNESNVYRQLELLNKAPQAPAVFEDLYQFLLEKEVQLVGAAAVDRGLSHAASSKTLQVQPCLSLYLAHDSFMQSGVDPRGSNWSGKWRNTEYVRDQWRNLCDKYNVSNEYYSDEMFVFVHDFHLVELVSLVYRSKSAIRRHLESKSRARPRVFVSSKPKVTVLFPSKVSHTEAQGSGELDRLKVSILEILRQGDHHACLRHYDVGVSFLDAETSASKLYELYRED
jgi:hypothetical protein